MRASVYLVITTAILLALAVGCAPAAPTAAPTKPSSPAAATAAPKAPAAATAAPAAATKPAAAATATPAAKVKRGGTLRVGYDSEWAPNLDPHVLNVQAFGYEMVYDTLVRTSIDAKTGARTLKPGLAESWQQPDAKTIVMKLRKDVVFQDGSKFDATVAKWNLDRMLTYAKSAAKEDVAVIGSVDVVDDSTIRINLKAAPSGLLYRISDGGRRAWIISKAAIDKDGDEALTRRMVGSGPMQFVDWITGDRINLKKWDKSWEKGLDGQPLPYLDAAVLRVMRDETVALTDMRTGNLDIFIAVQPRNYQSVRSDPNLDLVEYTWGGDMNYLIFNMSKPPFGDNQKLRQAALYSIDREAIAKGVSLGVGRPAYYYWAPGDLGYDETLPKYSYDVNKAKQLMKDAGFPNGLDVTNDFFTEQGQRTAEAMKQYLDAVGIRTALTMSDRTAFVSKLQSGNFAMATSARQWGEFDPESYSFRITSTGISNFAHWNNADLDKCMEEGRSIADDTKRAEIYKRCQKIIFEDGAYDQVWYQPYASAISKKVKGWEPHFYSKVKIRDIWLDK